MKGALLLNSQQPVQFPTKTRYWTN